MYMNKKHYCSTCNIGFDSLTHYQRHCETQKHKNMSQSPKNNTTLQYMNEHENLVAVMIMEQKQNPSAPRLRMYQPPRQMRYNVGVRGLIFFLLALIVLFIGFVGYLEYDRLVKPYIEFYICCLPAIVLAGLLFFLGFASKITTIRQVQIQKPRPIPQMRISSI